MMGEFREGDRDSKESQSVSGVSTCSWVEYFEQEDARSSRAREVYVGSDARSVGGWRQ